MTRFHFTLMIMAVAWARSFIPNAQSLPLWIPLSITAFAIIAMVAGVTLPWLNFFGKFINRAPIQRQAVALTFDDGPNPDTTPALLDFLKSSGIRAIFFCIGNKVAKHPDLIERMLKEGHIIGNHSMLHHPATNIFRSSRLRRDIAAAQAIIQEISGATPVYFRPPMGLSNPRLFPVLRELGLQAVGWTTRAFDSSNSKPEKLAARLIRGVRPGAILLLHDNILRKDTMEQTLRLLLDNLAARGYQIERLDLLLK